MNKLFIEINNKQFPIETNDKVLSCFIANKLRNQSYVDYIDEKIIVKQDFFSPKLEVLNVCRYIIKKENDSYILVPFENKNPILIESIFNDNLIDYRKDIKDTFILILESPHEHEYTPTFKPKAPAQCKTGSNIETILPKILNKNIEKLNLTASEYRLIIINPIPAQTSLNYLHAQSINKTGNNDNSFSLLRNNVWKTLWSNNESYKNKFIDDLKNINPKIILNCCTKDLSDYVSSAIIESKTNSINYKTWHPSSWHQENYIMGITNFPSF